MKNKTIIAIIGIPGSGKTSFANKLSTEFAGIPILNTDVLKTIYEPENKEILSKVSHNSWELAGEYSTEDIRKGYAIFSRTLFQYTYSIAKKMLNTYTTVIAEGMGIDIVDLADLEENVICVLLTNYDRDKSYSDKIKFRINKTNNWEKRKEILSEIENYLFDNYKLVEKSACFDIHDEDMAIKYVKEQLVGGI